MRADSMMAAMMASNTCTNHWSPTQKRWIIWFVAVFFFNVFLHLDFVEKMFSSPLKVESQFAVSEEVCGSQLQFMAARSSEGLGAGRTGAPALLPSGSQFQGFAGHTTTRAMARFAHRILPPREVIFYSSRMTGDGPTGLSPPLSLS